MTSHAAYSTAYPIVLFAGAGTIATAHRVRKFRSYTQTVTTGILFSLFWAFDENSQP